ncbi:MAG: GNAT family N-acetyltransferase [Clostridium sp.]|nr:GNAT family N-acetyltransferase [Clostridium sp.]
MKNCGTQRIETDRLILRRYVIEDADAMYKNWAPDSEVTKFLTWQPHSSVEVSRGIIENWLKEYSDKKYYQWAIVLKDNGNEPIGDISVGQMNEDISMVHIGYCLGRAWWRRGIMSEALKAVMHFMFDTVEVNRVESRHDPMNPNSGKVMQKCGMKYEGTLRSADRNNQGICDACYYALLRSER